MLLRVSVIATFAAIASSALAGNTTRFKGVTWIDRPIVLTPADSGRVFEGEEGAVISGGVRLGPWKDVGGGVWEADAPRGADGKVEFFDQLWVNSRRAACARLPNEGHFKLPKGGASVLAVTNAAGPTGTYVERATFTNAEAEALADVPAAALPYVRMRVIHSWCTAFRSPVAFDRATRTVTCESKRGWTVWQHWDERTLVSFENVPSAFDAPGEWLLDVAAGKVRYRPLPDEAMDEAEIVAPRRGLVSLVEFRGNPARGEYVTDVVFRNLSFLHVAAQDDDNRPHHKYQFQAALDSRGAVQAHGARNCSFERCRFAHTGGYGLKFTSGCVSNRVVDCVLEDLGAGGVWMGEEINANDTARKAAIARKVLRPTAPTSTAFNLVSNCVVRQAGRYDAEGVGVALGHCSDTRVIRNDIHDLYYSGVSVGWTWGFGGSVAQRNEIAFNRIWDLGKGVLSDMGGVYMLGTAFGSHVHDNIIHDVRSYAYGGWALYCDEGSEGVVMERNLCWNTTDGGFHQHYGTGCTIRNNIFLFNRELGAVRMYRDVVKGVPCTLNFLNNIVLVDRGPLCGKGVRRVGGVWANNVWWDVRGEGAAEFDGLSWEQWRACGKESNGVFADPRFTDLKDGDYSLRGDSPALKLGFKTWDYLAAGTDGRLTCGRTGSDADRIDALVARAVRPGGNRRVELKRNALRADGAWRLDRAIVLPSDITFVVDDCRVELSPGVRDNLFRNEGIGDNLGQVPPAHGIRLLGRGNAVLSGGKENHYKPQRSGDPHGWPSVGILLSNVTDYEIGNLAFEETQCWAISQDNGCRRGHLHDLHFGSSNRMRNQDGIDVRKGCSDILIENITGQCGDDVVALTGLMRPKDKRRGKPGAWKRPMQPGGWWPTDDDEIRNVTIRNVRAKCSGGHGLIRLLCQDGVKLHHVLVSNIVETATAADPVAYATIRIGDVSFWSIKRNEMGDMHHITVKDVESKAKVGVWVKGPLADSSVTDIRVAPDRKKYDVSVPVERVEFDAPGENR